MAKCSRLCDRLFRHSDFVIPSDFVIRHSGFRIAVCSIQKAGQRTGEWVVHEKGVPGWDQTTSSARPSPQGFVIFDKRYRTVSTADAVTMERTIRSRLP